MHLAAMKRFDFYVGQGVVENPNGNFVRFSDLTENQKLVDEQAEAIRNPEGGHPPPYCPHCKVRMRPMEYVGYYEGFPYWSCDCEAIPGSETAQGSYA